MSAEEDVKIQRDLNDEINKTAEAYSKLKESQQDILFFARDYADEAKKASKEVLGSTIAASSTAKAFKDVAAAAKKITDNYSGVLTGEKQFVDLQKESIALEASKASLTTEYAQALTAANVPAEDQVKILNGTLNVFDALDASSDTLTEAQYELLDLFDLQNQQLNDEAANMAEIAKRAEVIDDAMRPLGKHAISLQDMGEGLSKGLSKAGLGGLSDKLGMEEAIGGARKTAAELTKGGKEALGFGGKLDVAGNMAKTMGKNIMKSLGPAALIATAIDQIVKAFSQIDGQSGEVAKSMGVSYNEARQLNAEMADAAAMSGDLLVSSKDVVAANLELNKIFGTSAKFTGKFAAEFASIKERTGLSAHAMELFAEKAFLTGTSIEDQLVKVTAVTQELNNQNNVAFSAKEIQEGIAQMSNSQILNNRMNTKEMANQVFQAKLLGISQSQLENVQSSLLDFESSIAAEMKAELLTGKQLNLEGARAAALSGKQSELAAEIRKEIGTAAEFSEYNVIQQEALAAAMGMSRDDMAGMLIEQEKLVKLQNVFGDEVKSVSEAQAKYNKLEEEGLLTAEMKKKLAKEGVLDQMKTASQQDKMNAAMEKFSDLFIQLVDPLMPIIDALMAILGPVMSILSPIAKLIGDIVGLIMTYLNPALKSLTTYFEGYSEVITGLFNLDFGMMVEGFKKIGKAIIGFVVAPLDGAIALANLVPGVDMPLASTKIAGMVGLAEGGIVTVPTTALIGEGGEPEAVIPLSKASSMGFGGSDEIKQTNALLKELISAVKQGGDVYIDGAKAGRSLALATSRMG